MQGEHTCDVFLSYLSFAPAWSSAMSDSFGSVDFAQYLLQGYYTRASNSLLDPDMSTSAHVLELG